MKEANCKRPGSIYMAFGKRQNWIEKKTGQSLPGDSEGAGVGFDFKLVMWRL